MISMPQLIILLIIIVVVFGTGKLKNIGSDLGNSLKGFKKAMKDDDKDADFDKLENQSSDSVSETNVAKEKQKEEHTNS